MENVGHIYQLHKLLRNRRSPITRDELQSRLGLSRATLTRLIKFCRNQVDMPIEYNRDLGGYVYTQAGRESFELPGLWFNRSQLLALLTSHRLLSEVQPGILKAWIDPLQQRIEQLLTDKQTGSKEIFKRIRILPMANRVPKLEDFQQVADALVKRKQLCIEYASRSKGDVEERIVSPQRMIYYRDNWYLDAWCHLRNSLRTFALDRMHVVSTGERARDIADSELDTHVRGQLRHLRRQSYRQCRDSFLQ